MTLAPATFQTAVARINISYKFRNGPEHLIELKDIVLRPGQPFTNDAVEITTDIAPAAENKSKQILNIRIKALKALELKHFESKYLVELGGQRMLANGFQSWSQARELDAEDRISPIRSTVAYLTKYNLQGDYDFFEHSGEKGHIHSSSYTHFRDVTNLINFFGSLSEDLGYTYFKADFNNNTMSVYKDVLGKHLDQDQSINLVKIFLAQGKDAEKEIWDAYASYFPDRRSLKGDMHRVRHVNGWTSWYNYYGDVSEEIVLSNLKALQEHKYPINIFQIDDGFQTAIGDWLSINDKFPNKLKPVVEKISAAGFTAGLWLAPYAVGFTSKLATEHPDWLITDPETNKPVVAGPNWGGFYALDIYNKDARAYLKVVFDTVLRDWGFGMVKLDFLFAAAMIPRSGKSRGEIMWDAMELARELTGSDKLLLGCGVPLACAWRSADYCRIGSDVAPWWEGKQSRPLKIYKASLCTHKLD
ncbi:glycoside hydrolase superfamily [Zychaea mexicana]|uniref:glycoside hydrolase superfamily n=1 Tax=Zychaea mexicana TaxID=64656 RepID=UPI0022FE600D|nr:glycoside hydrolase superfamily [Zychaea mexicana]KAI9491355.1 glycoside hydrolase superfamily [Zychaea mexicana]